MGKHGLFKVVRRKKWVDEGRSALRLRGGYAEIDEDDDDDDFDENDFSDNSASGKNIVSGVTEFWRKTPPMTQYYCGASIGITLLCWALNKNAWPEMLHLKWSAVLSGQIWRPFTSFLFFGPFGLNYILTLQFVWTYMAQMEKLNYNQPEVFFTMLLFGAVTLLVGYSLLGLSGKFLGHNLSTYLVYIWARVFEGTDVNVMDLFLLKAELLPWFFCAQTYILEGEVPFADLLGIAVGHIYHYVSQKKIIQPPAYVKTLFSSPALKQKYLKFKDDFE
jgi:Derlin-2/3